MSELIVLAFDSEEGAGQMVSQIDRMQKLQLITLDDAAVVTRDMDGKAKVHQSTSLVGAGTFGGAFWGMLIGLLFWMPWLGLALGAVTGALAGKFSDYGVDDNFIKEVSRTIAPGTSALFLLVRESTPDRVLDELKQFTGVSIIRTSLSKESEDKLREAFGAGPAAHAA